MFELADKWFTHMLESETPRFPGLWCCKQFTDQESHQYVCRENRSCVRNGEETKTPRQSKEEAPHFFHVSV